MQENNHLTKWVKLRKYCEASGDTPNAVYAKRKRGIWVDGQQCKVGPDGNLWVNLIEVDKWVENGNRATLYSIRGG